MKLDHIFQLGIKELRSVFRDPMLLILIIYAFTLSIYTASRAAPETLSNTPIAIVDEDSSPLSTRIATAFLPPYFITPVDIDQSQIDSRMDQGVDTFAVDIPPNFQRDVLAGRSPAIQLNVDATRTSQALTGSGYIQQIVDAEVREFLDRYRSNAPQQVSLTLRARFNPELNKSWFGSIINVINSITMLSIILTGTALIREREHGTVEHLLVMPVTPTEIMISKVWSMGMIVLVAATFSLIFIVQGLLKVPIEGSIPLFLMGTVLQLFATTSMGIALATVAGSMPQFGLLLMLVLMPLQILSGGSTPRESMPEVIQNIMLAAPNTHFIMMAQSILYRGAGFSVVWVNFAALALIGALLFAFSLNRFRATLK
ncbi:ABC transporter permease [Bartonella sp. LJL80]